MMMLTMTQRMMMMISFVQCVIIICFCLPVPLNGESLKVGTNYISAVSPEMTQWWAILEVSNKYRTELNKLEFKSN